MVTLIWLHWYCGSLTPSERPESDYSLTDGSFDSENITSTFSSLPFRDDNAAFEGLFCVSGGFDEFDFIEVCGCI